ncbi:MAG: proton-conducting membrane transporter, partial [Lachnospiraceae bacterium]|nr:proton-conducting membrane transporter [Lachnospiraceae bacterium]
MVLSACSSILVLSDGLLALIKGVPTVKLEPLVLFNLLDNIPVMFYIDEVGTIFAWVATVAFVCAGAFSFRYMKGEKNYYGFFLMTYGVLQGLDFAGNLVTMYLFFEMVTLLSFPLVMQTKTKESIMAALKYIFYSLAGAYMGLFAIYFLYQNTHTLTFTPGGTLDPVKVAEHPTLILVAVMFALIGFGVKAGMFPMHAWLPTAHPVAPAPASAVLSGV